MIRALIRAQVWDMVRNPMLIVFWSILPAMGAVMKLMVPESQLPFLSSMLLLMAAYFVGWNLPAHTLAEEKEKRQLESLFLTPVRPWHVLAVKAGLGVVLSLLFGLCMALILGRVPAHPGLLVMGYLLVTLFTVAGGTLLGLLVKDLRTVGTGGTPVLLALIFASTLPWELFQPGVWAVQAYLPTRPAVELLRAGYEGTSGLSLLHAALVMIAYTGLLLFFCIRLVRRLAFAPRS